MSGRSVAVALGYRRVDDAALVSIRLRPPSAPYAEAIEPGRSGHGDEILGTGLVADEADFPRRIAAGGAWSGESRQGESDGQAERTHDSHGCVPMAQG